MKIKANSVEEYITLLPENRKETITKLRETVLNNLPEGFKEEINYDMIGYVVPHSIYPRGYHCNPSLPVPFINIGSQKNYIGFYHMGLYGFEEILEWFKTEYQNRCKYKLDMGKSCVRFKKLDDIPYDLIGELVSKISLKEWIEFYEKTIN